jgi:hypothetical protein
MAVIQKDLSRQTVEGGVHQQSGQLQKPALVSFSFGFVRFFWSVPMRNRLKAVHSKSADWPSRGFEVIRFETAFQRRCGTGHPTGPISPWQKNRTNAGFSVTSE